MLALTQCLAGRWGAAQAGPSNDAYAWARSERGFPPACGAVTWVVKLSKKSGGYWHKVGVVSDAFKKYTASARTPKKSWFFSNCCIYVDGELQGYGDCFRGGDVVTVELERRHGQDGVMRVRVAGKAFDRDMTGLPRDGMLYPAVCLLSKQSYSMVAAQLEKRSICCHMPRRHRVQHRPPHPVPGRPRHIFHEDFFPISLQGCGSCRMDGSCRQRRTFRQ
jgi:hypothetical protein